jgi:hypothetical protein
MKSITVAERRVDAMKDSAANSQISCLYVHLAEAMYSARPRRRLKISELLPKAAFRDPRTAPVRPTGRVRDRDDVYVHGMSMGKVDELVCSWDGADLSSWKHRETALGLTPRGKGLNDFAFRDRFCPSKRLVRALIVVAGVTGDALAGCRRRRSDRRLSAG